MSQEKSEERPTLSASSLLKAMRSDGEINGHKMLRGRQGRGMWSGQGGIGLMLFGGIFVAVGTGISLMGLKVIPVDPSRVHAPYWVISLIGLIFALPGLAVMGLGAAGLVRASRRKRLQAMRPHAPWLADYAWKEQGAIDNPYRKVIGQAVAAVLVGVFLIPFNYFVFFDGKMPGFAMFIIGIFDLALVFLLCSIVYYLMRALKYGTARLSFEQFPYELGGVLAASFHAGRGIGRFRSVTFTLRCIQEEIIRRRTSKGTSTQYVPCEVWSDEFKVDQAGELGGGDTLPLTFALPDDVSMTTALSENPPRYWEIEVNADTPGVDYHALFLVPVYAKRDEA